MTSIKSLKANIEANLSMRGLVEVYEELAATKMKEIREAILTSRDYYRGLAVLSSEIGADLSSAQQKNEKEALVLLSSNEGMYGEIVDKVFGSFVTAVRNNPSADVYIAGKVGQELMAVIAPNKSYVSLALPFTEMNRLLPYRRVELYYGQFESIARQEPANRILSAGTIEMTKQEWAGEVSLKLKYLYEPTIPEISQVFGDIIFSGIVEQTIKEDQLAKNASRLMHLDEAFTNIEKKLEIDKHMYRKHRKRLSSRKQQTQSVSSRAKARRSYLYT